MIPPANPQGNLPPGIHECTWKELKKRFGDTNDRRRQLYKGLVRAATMFQAAGCLAIYLDGSYITETELPGDYDACWDYVPTVDLSRIDPVMKDFHPNIRLAQKLKYKGDWFPSTMIESDSGQAFLEFFQVDRNGETKGILKLLLKEIS